MYRNMKTSLLGLTTIAMIGAMIGATSPAAAFDASVTAMPTPHAAEQKNLLKPVSDLKLKQAQNFIQTLGEDAIAIMADTSLSRENRQAKFKTLLKNHFDMKTIGRFTLGRYWRVADDGQQKEFLRLFKDMVLEVYSRRFEEYSGQIMTVETARFEGKKDIIVNALVVSPSGGPKIRVDWRVRNRGTHSHPKYKVIDVIVEGISMSLTQRSDFASIIQRNGGQIQPLLVHLGG